MKIQELNPTHASKQVCNYHENPKPKINLRVMMKSKKIIAFIVFHQRVRLIAAVNYSGSHCGLVPAGSLGNNPDSLSSFDGDVYVFLHRAIGHNPCFFSRSPETNNGGLITRRVVVSFIHQCTASGFNLPLAG